MIAPGTLDRIVGALLEQSTGRGRPLAPILHLHGSAGWKLIAVNVASPDELEGSLDDLRQVCQFESVDAFVCILRGADAPALAEGLAVSVGAVDDLAYAAAALGSEPRQSTGLEEVRPALASLLLSRPQVR